MCVICACIHQHDMAPQKLEEGFRSKGAEATGDCGPFSVCARKRTQILSKISTCPKLLSHLSSP